jgi:hypothetical protein
VRPNRARTDTHGRGRASGRAVLAIALPYASSRLYRDGVLEAKDFPVAQISDYLQLDLPPGGGHRGYAAVVDGSRLMVACCCSHSMGDR